MSRTAHRLVAAASHATLASALIHEALLGQRLARIGFAVSSEVRTRGGRACDLVAVRDDLRLHFHLKGVRTAQGPAMPPLPRALRALTLVRRRLVVEIECPLRAARVRWTPIVAELSAFVRRASVSDEHIVRDAQGRTAVRCRIRAAHRGESVHLVVGVDPEPERTRRRIARALKKAHDQFLNGGENIIVLHGSAKTQCAVDEALLGTPIERWDRLPRRLERVALGRAEDGFWHGGAASESRLVAWVLDSAPDRRHALHVRGTPAAQTLAVCRTLFADD